MPQAESATQPGAQDTTPASPTSRMDAMQAIADRNRDKMADENGITIEPADLSAARADAGLPPLNEDDNPDDNAAELARQQLAGQLETPQEPAPQPQTGDDDLDKRLVRVKIDGVEREVPLDELTRRYQKNEAADARLAEATRILNEARATAAAMAAAPTQQAAPAAEPPKTGADELAPSITEAFNALYEGDVEGAASRFEALLQGRQQSPIPDAQALAAQVKEQLSVEDALDRGAAAFPHVVQDAFLADLADRHVAAALAAGVPKAQAIEQGFQAADQWLRDKTGVLSGGQQQQPSQPRATAPDKDQRQLRKAAQALPRTAHATASGTPTTPRTEDQIRADGIAQLRASRAGGRV